MRTALHFQNRQFPDIIEMADSTPPPDWQNPLMGGGPAGQLKMPVSRAKSGL